MMNDSSSTETDSAELKVRLAHLKIDEADLLREVAEKSKELAAKEGELRRVRQQIAILTQPTKAACRPTRDEVEIASGNADQVALPVLIEKLLREYKDGLSLADLFQKIREMGYVGPFKKPRLMLDQAVLRLKKEDRVSRNPETMKFFLK